MDPNHSTYQSPVPNQRLSPKSHLNSPPVKPNSDSSRIQKPWQESDAIPNKPQNLPSVPAKNPNLPATKSQVIFVTFLILNYQKI